ncbi:MAG TPA: circularly permuted type 2 ATP-grasp protein [Planctomycetaceae bacterium]|nr:circularly permuted type 2 ATP-grasp protein [Planctomycetaceae bacterium]
MSNTTLQSPIGLPSEPGDGWLDYSPGAENSDELFDRTGAHRAHWNEFLKSLQAMGPHELTRRWSDVQQLIRENGVTYNVYGDPQGMNRPWQLDPIPFLIAAEEAQTIERGLIQRGRLLEALMGDLYGPQRCLAAGLLPRELLFGNPAFLRSCHNLHVLGDRSLHLYGANLARAADGAFRVLGDRTQAPSGAGYALENRLVLSRTLPDAFRDCRVQRLAPFFRTLRETLQKIAPHNRDNPRIILLTPGPYNETYFEHAYLARYLGFTLAEGGDLAVRDNRVYLKVLGALQPVDVILRRLDDDFCDPLELRPDSFLGVPGLVQAARSGNVAVANALGTGLLETPAFLAFLPGLSRELLGEELLLPSVATWWCGEAWACQHVIEHLHDLVIKPAHAGIPLEPAFGDELTSQQLADLVARIRSRPHDFVAQERLTLSTTPALAGERLAPRHFVLRAYLAAHDDTFVMMPGGLTRFSASPEKMVVSMQRGGGSKDTWVLSEGPVSNLSLLPPGGLPVAVNRGGNELPSRVADNLYWLGRYAERAEGLARLLRGVLVRMTERSGFAETPELPRLLQAVTLMSGAYPGFVGEGAESRLAAPETELLSVIYDAKLAGSVVSVLGALFRVAGTARDRISRDMWRVVSDLADRHRGESRSGTRNSPAGDGETATCQRGRTLSEALDELDRAVLTLAAFSGLSTDSLTRGDGWRFLDLGRKLERSLHTVSLLRSTLVTAASPEAPLLEALLEIADSSMTYRRRYLGSVQPAAVLDLLLADEGNPRSLAFQMAAVTEHLERLPRDADGAARRPEQRLMLAALTAVRLGDADRLAAVDPSGRRADLEQLLNEAAQSLPAVSDAITQTYLSHLQASRQLSSPT